VDNFAGQTNTAVASATSPGQTASYGGYDDDAAGALKPGQGTNGQSVHDAGVAGKASGETPTTGGGLALSDFDLSPVDPTNGPVKSRHVIVYAGIPDGSPGRDNDQATTIVNNFAGQPNTSVTTVGGDGTGTWNHPGSAKGLRDAIKAAGQEIDESGHPGDEQFILFVTDHGDLHDKQAVQTQVDGGTGKNLQQVQSFQSSDIQSTTQITDPGFSVTIDLYQSGLTHAVGDPLNYTPFFQSGDWGLDLYAPDGTWNLTEFTETYIEDDNGIIGDAAGEGLKIEFDLDPDAWVESFFDVNYDVDIWNHSGSTVFVDSFSQDTGAVGKVPEPATLAMLTLGAVAMLRRRR
jgi:hypothetical protein